MNKNALILPFSYKDSLQEISRYSLADWTYATTKSVKEIDLDLIRNTLSAWDHCFPFLSYESLGVALNPVSAATEKIWRPEFGSYEKWLGKFATEGIDIELLSIIFGEFGGNIDLVDDDFQVIESIYSHKMGMIEIYYEDESMEENNFQLMFNFNHNLFSENPIHGNSGYAPIHADIVLHNRNLFNQSLKALKATLGRHLSVENEKHPYPFQVNKDGFFDDTPL